MTILEELNLDADTFRWEDLATCQYLPDETEPLKLFFENYLASDNARAVVNEMCATCPVKDACLDAGMESKSTGVFGGHYLENGEIK